MPLEDDLYARLRELTREVRKVREGLTKELRSGGRRPVATADERMRSAAEPDPAKPKPEDPDQS